MDSLPQPLLAVLLLTAIAAVWVLCSVAFDVIAGWPALRRRYPDRPDKALQAFKAFHSRVGGMRYRRAWLNITVCREGLRLEMPRFFSPLREPCFVTWSDIGVQQDADRNGSTIFSFGRPLVGYVIISSQLADQIAEVAPPGSIKIVNSIIPGLV